MGAGPSEGQPHEKTPTLKYFNKFELRNRGQDCSPTKKLVSGDRRVSAMVEADSDATDWLQQLSAPGMDVAECLLQLSASGALDLFLSPGGVEKSVEDAIPAPPTAGRRPVATASRCEGAQTVGLRYLNEKFLKLSGH